MRLPEPRQEIIVSIGHKLHMEIGVKAPDFTLADQNGDMGSLSDYKGKRGSVSSHKKFEETYGLPFTLLSDTEKEVIQAYDVWKEKKNYGKVSMGVVRTTYLINEEGVLEKAFGNVKAAENPQKMLSEL